MNQQADIDAIDALVRHFFVNLRRSHQLDPQLDRGLEPARIDGLRFARDSRDALARFASQTTSAARPHACQQLQRIDEILAARDDRNS